MWSVALAAIRIPVPPEAMPWIFGVFLVIVVALAVYLTGRLWKVWGFPAWAVVALAGIITGVLQALSAMSFPSLLGLLAFNVAPAAALVWSALLFWGLRRRVDVKGALMAAAAYAVVWTPLEAMLSGLRVGSLRAVGLLISPESFLFFAVQAAGLLVGLSLAVALVKPTWRAALLGLAAGQVVGSLASLVVPATFGGGAPAWLPAILWSLVEGLVLGALAAAAVRWLKPEEAGRVVPAPARRA